MIEIDEIHVALGSVTEKNDITRYNLILNSHFKLKEIRTNNVVLLKKFNSETSFSASINITDMDDEAKKFPIVTKVEKDVTLNSIMSNSFGFGGTNATLVFEKV